MRIETLPVGVLSRRQGWRVESRELRLRNRKGADGARKDPRAWDEVELGKRCSADSKTGEIREDGEEESTGLMILKQGKNNPLPLKL